MLEHSLGRPTAITQPTAAPGTARAENQILAVRSPMVRHDRPCSIARRHAARSCLGNPRRNTLVEYVSYTSPAYACINRRLSGSVRERMRYSSGSPRATGPCTARAELGEYASETTAISGRSTDALEARADIHAGRLRPDRSRIQAAAARRSAGDSRPSREAAGAGGCRERTAQRRAHHADLLHQQPPLRGAVGREHAGRRDARHARAPAPCGFGRFRAMGAIAGLLLL